jgi:hypothetical protein
MFYLIRNLQSPKGWQIWHSSPVPDDLDGFLKICRENWSGDFEIVSEFELEAQRDKIQAKDYVAHFR